MRVNDTRSGSPSRSFADRVAAEIRAELGRQDIRYVRLAERLGENEVWVSRKVRGRTPLTINDLERIAAALDVPITHLIPKGDDENLNRRSPQMAERTTPLPGHADPILSRPPHVYPLTGHTQHAHPNIATRRAVRLTTDTTDSGQ